MLVELAFDVSTSEKFEQVLKLREGKQTTDSLIPVQERKSAIFLVGICLRCLRPVVVFLQFSYNI